MGVLVFLPLCQVAKNRFQRIFLPSHSLDTVSPSDMLFCFEVLSKDLAKERVVLLRVQQVIKKNSFVVLRVSWGVTTRSERLRFAFQKLQVPSIPISKCAACLKPPVSEEDKLKRCTRCYRVGYCNQWASWDVSESNCKCLQLLLYFLSSVPPDIVRELTGPVTRVYVVPTLRT